MQVSSDHSRRRVGWAQFASHLPLSREALPAVALARSGFPVLPQWGLEVGMGSGCCFLKQAVESMEHHQFQEVSYPLVIKHSY